MKRIFNKLYRLFLKCWMAFCKRLPLRKRVLFFSIRAEGHLLENAQCVYDALDCKKTVFAHKYPMPGYKRPYIWYLLLTHKVVVTDDYLPYLREVQLRDAQRVFQIWHAGGGFKKMGFDVFPKPDNIHEQYDDVIVTAEGCRKFFSTAFRLPLDKIHAHGLPRTDKLHDPEYLAKTREAFLQRHPDCKGKRLYIYCPTFREKNGKRVRFDPKLDFDAIDKALHDDEMLLIHMHPTVDYTFVEKPYNHIQDVTKGEETLTLLIVATLLVTDYSSVIVEGSILKLPMLFYCPDFDTYERGFYLNYPEDLPGEMFTNGEDFVTRLRYATEHRSIEREEKYRHEQTSACDGNCTQRVVNVIERWLSES